MRNILILILVLVSIFYLGSFNDLEYFSSEQKSSASQISSGGSEYYGWGAPKQDQTQKSNEPIPIPVPIERCYDINNSCDLCDITKHPDIDKYVLKSSIPPCPDMDNYIHKSMIPSAPDMDQYMKISDCKQEVKISKEEDVRKEYSEKIILNPRPESSKIDVIKGDLNCDGTWNKYKEYSLYDKRKVCTNKEILELQSKYENNPFTYDIKNRFM